MKILAILGARKNGNTTETVHYFEKMLRQNIDFELEYLYLSDYPIDFCVGCHNCIFVGEDKCPQYQRVKEIEDKMLSADALILASPGYMFSVTGIMKNFLDHVAYNCHRPKYFGKKVYILASCTEWLAKAVYGPMETWSTGAGFKLVGKEFIDLLPFPLTEKELDKKRKKLQKAAIVFAKELSKKEELKPDFGGIIVFHVFRTLCSIAPNILKADYQYYKAKDAYNPKAEWYMPAKIGAWDNFMAKNIEKSMQKGVIKMTDPEKLKTAGSNFRNKL